MMNRKLRTLFVSSLLVVNSFFNTQPVFASDHGDFDPLVMPEEYYFQGNFYSTPEIESEEAENVIVECQTLYRVNLRTGASTEFERLIVVPEGETVYAVDYDADGWSQVIYNEYIGYIKTEFLQTVNKTGQAQNNQNYSNIQEDMPYIQESAVQISANGVELANWSEIKEVFTIGVPAAVYDVHSGRTYYVKSFSNGQHADVEPVTAEDTAIMKETFNGVWSWDVRPVWVTVNGRTFAGSINGMPHGGGVNDNNNMDGQVCIHFLHSTTHNGNSSYTKLHQDVLKEAFALAQN